MKERNPALDGVRAVAITAVVLYHTSVLPGGFLGVDVFFVLSGYLITALLLREWERTGNISLVAFYGRRIVRLWPALFVLLAIMAVIAPIAMLFAVFYATNIGIALGIDPAGPLTHTWSLSLEEQFYLLWPPLLVVMLWWHWSRRRIALALAVVTALMFGIAIGLSKDSSLNQMYSWHGAGLAGGCLLALILRGRETHLPSRWLPTAALAALAVIAAVIYLMPNGDVPATFRILPVFDTAVAVVTAAVVLSPAALVTRGLGLAPFAYLGRISYSLYLWHYPIAFAWNWTPAWHLKAITWVLSLMLAAGSYHLVEQPCVRAARRRHAPALVSRAPEPA